MLLVLVTHAAHRQPASLLTPRVAYNQCLRLTNMSPPFSPSHRSPSAAAPRPARACDGQAADTGGGGVGPGAAIPPGHPALGGCWLVPLAWLRFTLLGAQAWHGRR